MYYIFFSWMLSLYIKLSNLCMLNICDFSALVSPFTCANSSLYRTRRNRAWDVYRGGGVGMPSIYFQYCLMRLTVLRTRYAMVLKLICKQLLKQKCMLKKKKTNKNKKQKTLWTMNSIELRYNGIDYINLKKTYKKTTWFIRLWYDSFTNY